MVRESACVSTGSVLLCHLLVKMCSWWQGYWGGPFLICQVLLFSHFGWHVQQIVLVQTWTRLGQTDLFSHFVWTTYVTCFVFVFSCVYKCVCKQFSERLYSDLLNEITRHLERLSLELQVRVRTYFQFAGTSVKNHRNHSVSTWRFSSLCTKYFPFQVQEPFQYVERFNFAMNQYLQALGGIVPIFNYMVRNSLLSVWALLGVGRECSQNLKKCLLIAESILHRDQVEDGPERRAQEAVRHSRRGAPRSITHSWVSVSFNDHVSLCGSWFLEGISEAFWLLVVAAVLVEATTKPFAVAPQTMATMIKNLYELKPGIIHLRGCSSFCLGTVHCNANFRGMTHWKVAVLCFRICPIATSSLRQVPAQYFATLSRRRFGPVHRRSQTNVSRFENKSRVYLVRVFDVVTSWNLCPNEQWWPCAVVPTSWLVPFLSQWRPKQKASWRWRSNQ